jgi:hypothetical protein
MSVLGELWEWIRGPVEELEKSFTEEPGKSWETRRGEFLQRLGVQEPGQHPVTEQMFKHLDGMSDDERKTHVSSKQFETVAYGFAQQHAASQEASHGTSQAAAASGPGYDEQAWQNYLNTNATQWNGTEETWNQFTQWFLYYAEEHSVTTPATQLIDYLNPLPANQRITELARYGVTITPPRAPAAPQASEPGQPEASPEAQQEVAGIMDDVLAANPEFAAIPEERRIEIMNEALSRVQGAGN